jgi:hypothetical protein
MTCITPPEMMYPRGFDVWTMGGDPEFRFYNGADAFEPIYLFEGDEMQTLIPKSAEDNYVSVEDVTLEPTETGYRYRTRYPVGTALGAQSAGDDVAYTIETEGDDHYFAFDAYHPKMKVSYETPAVRHTVRFYDIRGAEITMVIMNRNTGETCEYDIDGIDWSDLSRIPCQLDQLVPIDVAKETGLPVADLRGIELNYIDPAGEVGSETIDVFGFIYIYVTMNGDYTVDISNLTAMTQNSETRRIILTVNVNLGA